MKIFFDTSTFAKRYIDEQNSDSIVQLCAEATELGLSIICFPELISTISTISRLKRERYLTLKQYKQIKSAVLIDIVDVTICQITPEIITLAIDVLENNTLRAMDALHIACAQSWCADLFVSADKAQLKAAKKSGLAVQQL